MNWITTILDFLKALLPAILPLLTPEQLAELHAILNTEVTKRAPPA